MPTPVQAYSEASAGKEGESSEQLSDASVISRMIALCSDKHTDAALVRGRFVYTR